MLTITDEATEAIGMILEQPGVPDGAGVRITSAMSQDSAGNDLFELAVAEQPYGTDQVLEQDSARVFVDDELVDLLANRTLDVDAHSDRMRFVIGVQ